MALPKLTTPTYELEVPSTDEKIQFRPFLVKEEKILMIAMEAKEQYSGHHADGLSAQSESERLFSGETGSGSPASQTSEGRSR